MEAAAACAQVPVAQQWAHPSGEPLQVGVLQQWTLSTLSGKGCTRD